MEDGCWGWLHVTAGFVRSENVFRSHLDSFGFSLRWSRVLSHGWIHVVSNPKDQLITSRLDEWMVSQRMISKGVQIILTI